jgi:hypothetical protein
MIRRPQVRFVKNEEVLNQHWCVGVDSYFVLSYIGKNYFEVKHENCGTIFKARKDSILNKCRLMCTKCFNQPVTIGDRYNKLLVIDGPKKRIIGIKKPRAVEEWLCLCDCGREKWWVANSIKHGRVLSCGCKMGKWYVDLTGQRFGRWIVLWRDNSIGRGEYWSGRWWCHCDCQENLITSVSGNTLRAGTSVSCGCEAREIASRLNSGELSRFWNGGTSQLSVLIRGNAKYLAWKIAVFNKFNSTCILTNKKTRKVEAHHVKPLWKIISENNITTLEEAVACGELWDVNNGIVLLEDWHSVYSKNPKAYHRMFANRNSSEETFWAWLEQQKKGLT